MHNGDAIWCLPFEITRQLSLRAGFSWQNSRSSFNMEEEDDIDCLSPGGCLVESGSALLAEINLSDCLWLGGGGEGGGEGGGGSKEDDGDDLVSTMLVIGWLSYAGKRK